MRSKEKQRHIATGKIQKSMKEEKVVGSNSASLFPARKRDAVTECTARRTTQGGWETKLDHELIPDTFT